MMNLLISWKRSSTKSISRVAESDKFWNLIDKWFHFIGIFEYRKSVLFEDFVLIVDNTFIILRNEMIAQRGFEIIKDARRQDDLINHVSIEGIECKIRHRKADLFILFNLNECQIIDHSEKSDIDNPSIACFIIVFTGLHWFCHGSNDRRFVVCWWIHWMILLMGFLVLIMFLNQRCLP